MKTVTCHQSELKHNLSFISRIVPNRPAQAILENVLIEANEETQQITLIGFDLSIGVKISFLANINESFKIAVPSKLLTSIVSRLQSQEITIVKNDENQLEIKSKSGTFKIQGLEPTEFPSLPEIESNVPVRIPAKALLDALNATVFASSSDEAKQVLRGVHFSGKEDTLELGATDGHRLATFSILDSNLELTENPLKATIPKNGLSELAKLLKTQKEETLIDLLWDDKQVSFETNSQKLTARILQGQYPAYDQLIPNSFLISTSVDREELIKKLDLMEVIADDKNKVVEMKVESSEEECESSQGKVILSTNSSQIGSGEDYLEAEIIGSSIRVGMNISYLTDGLKAMKCDQIKIQFNNPSTPIVIKPVDGTKMIYLVMPIELKN